MIGIDTNVLVRVFVDDDAPQTKAAVDFLSTLSQDRPAFIGMVVLIELVWVLKRNYGFKDEAIFVALDSLFDSSSIEIERGDLVQAALQSAQEIRADIADVLIALTATEAGAVKTVTFDKTAAKRIPGMELLA